MKITGSPNNLTDWTTMHEVLYRHALYTDSEEKLKAVFDALNQSTPANNQRALNLANMILDIATSNLTASKKDVARFDN